MKKTFTNFVAAAITLMGAIATTGVTHAATLTFDTSSDFELTDFTKTLSVQQFDPSLGTLESVTVEFIGDVRGRARFENLGPSPTDITVTVGGNLNLDLNSSSLFSLNPQQISFFDDVPGSDGTLDFGGTSGQTISGITDTEEKTETFTDELSLQPFIGTNNIDFLFSATATSDVLGSGNIASSIRTNAKTDIKVIYEYEEAVQSVPEPSAMLGLGVIAGLGLVSGGKKIQMKMSKS